MNGEACHRRPQASLIALLLPVLLMVGLVGCSDSGPQTSGSGGDGRVHAQSWSNPADRTAPTFHGQVAASEGTGECSQCHGASLAGSATIPGCRTCHFSPSGGRVPPGVDWTHGTLPHYSLLVYGETCNACHATYRANGLGPENCHDCHASAGHPLDRAWLDPASSTFHGLQAQADLDPCRRCHGQNLGGGITRVGCNGCHFGPTGARVPADSNWSHGSIPHDQFADQGGTCNACHNLLRSYGEGPGTCHDCHAGASHPLGQAWLDRSSATFHGLQARQDPTACSPCHGSDYRGGSSGVSCYQCHFGPSGTKVPPGVDWVHGTLPHDQPALVAAVANCEACHEVSRLYGNGPSPCHDCHLGATHPLGQPWLDRDSATFHGLAARADLDSCRGCHGSDLQGGVSGVSCNQCHFGPAGSKVPPGVNWSHGSVPHDSLADFIAVCNQCHSLERSYGHPPASCHDCHAGANHPLGQPWLDPRVSGYHGTAAAQDVDSCKSCHGADLLGGISGVSCNRCHFGPTGSKVPAGVTWTHGAVPHGSLSPYIATCNGCHTLERSFGIGPASCHDCHASANHPLGQAWLDFKVSGYHGDVAAQNVDSCQPCHGSDYQGGSSTVSCYQCHFGPTGSRVPSGVTWTHGTIPHAELAPYIAVCNQCHTVNRTYNNGPASCHDCHGSGAPHPVDGSYLSGPVHGPDAKGSASFPGGLLDCQACHGGSGGAGSNPRFNLGIASAGSQGCEGCHNDGTAHPSVSSVMAPPRENLHWYDGSYNHRNTVNGGCALCHGANFQGGVGPSCMNGVCHVSSPLVTPAGCGSCHGNPPDGTTAPNRQGQHLRGEHQLACQTCHTNSGPGSSEHFTQPVLPGVFSRADLCAVTTTGNMTITVTTNDVRCSGSCHSSKNWYAGGGD